jgi:hypothetical protein
VKIRKNKLKALKKQSGKNQKQKEGTQYKSGCELTEISESNILKKRKAISQKKPVTTKRRRSNVELKKAKTYKCSCGKRYTTPSNLLQHKKKSNHLQ